MLLLFKLHNIQSLWGLSFTFLCDLVKLIWQGSWRTCVGLGNLSSRRGHYLVVLAACGYFEIVGKDSICLTYGARNTGFSTDGEKTSQQLLLASRSCLLFSSSNLLHFFVSQSYLAEGVE